MHVRVYFCGRACMRVCTNGVINDHRWPCTPRDRYIRCRRSLCTVFVYGRPVCTSRKGMGYTRQKRTACGHIDKDRIMSRRVFRTIYRLSRSDHSDNIAVINRTAGREAFLMILALNAVVFFSARRVCVRCEKKRTVLKER